VTILNPVRQGSVVGGYRLLRILGIGERSVVWLGHAGDADSSRSVAIKIYRDGIDRASVERELHALTEATHAHVVQLRDLSSAVPTAPCLILERLSPQSLGAVLSARETVPPGEAVTMLAPVVAAVTALHESGIGHGQLSAQHVLFRPTGAPVLIGFGAADTEIDRDRGALVALVRLVINRVRCDEARRLDDWLSELSPPFAATMLRELSDRIFALGQPQPIQFGEHPTARDRVPARVASHELAPVEQRPEHRTQPPASHGIVDRLPSELRAVVLPLLEQATVRAALARARRVRRPVWLAIGGAALLATLGLAVLPSSPRSPSANSRHATAPSSVATAAPSAGDSAVPVESATRGAVAGDDPLAAFTALWATRRACVMDLSVLCLDDVVQNGSAAMDDDAALIRAIEGGSTDGSLVAQQPAGAELVERHGDAALVAFTIGPDDTPASVLLVKAEAGWRIRDYLGG
jgi:eukaryotic-like serine/threonine-protein kinase